MFVVAAVVPVAAVAIVAEVFVILNFQQIIVQNYFLTLIIITISNTSIYVKQWSKIYY